ncbi:MAG: DUF6498-containing protein [Cutibacterium avidum]|nr:DUF6498-containing protein [Cutibacterium avidum]MDU5830204.1 DUF6498-containing protein [Cutibacterium avidum]
MTSKAGTTYAIIVGYNLLTLVGVILWHWPVGNILLLGWAENVMFVIGATLANALVHRISRRTGRSIPSDPSAGTASTDSDSGDGVALDATASPVTFLLLNLFFCVVHLTFAGVLAAFTGVSFTLVAFWVPLATAAFRHVAEEFNDSLSDPEVRWAKDVRAAHDANRRVMVQHLFIMAAFGFGFFGADKLGGVHGLLQQGKMAILGVLLLYVVAKTFVEVRIAWSRDHVTLLNDGDPTALTDAGEPR